MSEIEYLNLEFSKALVDVVKKMRKKIIREEREKKTKKIVSITTITLIIFLLILFISIK